MIITDNPKSWPEDGQEVNGYIFLEEDIEAWLGVEWNEII